MPSLPRIRLRRIRQVVGEFYELGFGTWIKKMELRYAVPLHKRFMRLSKKTRDLPCPMEEDLAAELRDFPKNFRLTLERLGGTFVKLGQMLSLRADLVTQPVADELRGLQGRVPPFSSDLARAAIEKEFGKPIGKIFKEFDDEPVGCASLAQVHRAVLPDGREVAVKVLRPGIEGLVREDVSLLKWLARQLEERVPSIRRFQPARAMEEFADWTLKELNLVNEAVNIEHFRSMFAGEEGIFIPAVEWRLTAKRVLTTEFSHGAPMDDFAAYRRLKSSRKKIAEIGTRLVYRQFFEFGFFHGDPHPGNFFVASNNSVCLHDFGIVGHLDTPLRRELIGCFVDFLEKDADGAIQHLLHMAHTDEQTDLAGFQSDVRLILERWFYGPTAGERLTTAFYKVIVSGLSRGVIFPTNIVLVAKAAMTMESMALMLDPDFDIVEQLRPYLNKLFVQEFKPERVAKRARETLLDAANLADSLPEAARKMIKLVSREEVGIKLDTREFLDIKKEIDRQTDVRLLSFFLVADLLATTVLLRLEGVERVAGLPLGSVGLLIAVILSVVVLLKIRQRPL